MTNRASIRAFAATLAIAAALPAAPATADIVARRDGSKAVYAPADTTHHSITAGDSFDWADAAIGAGAVLAAGIAAAGAVSVRIRRRPRAMGLS
jgi:hypothetical protein